MPHLPEPAWHYDGTWLLRYAWFPTEPVEWISHDEAREFLLFCLEKRLVCANIKRSNFRRRPGGGLTFVDIGRWIVPMAVEVFRDAAARLYAISALAWSDERLQAQRTGLRTEAGLAALDGFDEFYRDLLTQHAQRQWSAARVPEVPARLPAADVTLLVKACAMDADSLSRQLLHLVSHLEWPRPFAERVLLIDPFRGPFLRAHAEGDYAALRAAADSALRDGLVDRVLVAPDDPGEVAEVNARWFGLGCAATHSSGGVPISPQLWGLEQVRTRHVLQCDVDVLIGRRDLAHDFLGEMLAVASPEDVLGIAFNIPHPPDAGLRPYDAPPGDYVPEVRCGLLDLTRLMARRPLPNQVLDGKLEMSWYRSLQQYQWQHGLRTLRGGDPRTFYVHPSNEWKRHAAVMARVRDLVGQARLPEVQYGQWDLAGREEDWGYSARNESVVFLVKGRDTPVERVRRCVASLAIQDDRDFGVVVIDDASTHPDTGPLLHHLFAPLRERTTLIRHEAHWGRVPNFRLGIRDVCRDPDTLVAILDLDDALMDRSAVRRLREAHRDGADVVLAAMFRPDKPYKLYHPDFKAPREQWGGDVWIHLRAFRKRLFDALPDEVLQLDGAWIEHCTDYATMVPIVERCVRPSYVGEYLYFHERSTPRTAEL
ncbi:MAG TPA: glycosyltransferase, partial [Longimicrobium sp.]|nr:glycosyltransferase [Longimicrobium sp.]